MSENRYQSVANEVWRALDADEEHYITDEIEVLPIGEIKQRLVELDLSPELPPELNNAVRASTSVGVEILGFLDHDAVEIHTIEELPLEEVTRRLQEMGVNYRAGASEISDLVERHASAQLYEEGNVPWRTIRELHPEWPKLTLWQRCKERCWYFLFPWYRRTLCCRIYYWYNGRTSVDMEPHGDDDVSATAATERPRVEGQGYGSPRNQTGIAANGTRR
jgi:hypothetical protein